MVKLFTNPEDLRGPDLARPRGIDDSGRLQAIASFSNTALGAGQQFIESRKKRVLGDHLKSISDTVVRNMNADRLGGGLQALNDDELRSLDKTQAQINRIRLKERQRGNVRGVQAELLALQNNALASHPGMRLEMEQLFQSATGQTTGGLGLSLSADPMATDISNDILDLANPDHKRIADNLSVTSAYQTLMTMGVDISSVNPQEAVRRASAENSSVYEQNKRMALDQSTRSAMSVTSMRESLRQQLDPNYAANKQSLQEAALWWDKLNPNDTGASAQKKRDAYAIHLNQKLEEEKTNIELQNHRSKMELDPAYSAQVITQRAVSELYAKYSNNIDAQNVPYGEKFNFISKNFQTEFLTMTQKLKNELNEAVNNDNPQSRAMADSQYRMFLEFEQQVGGLDNSGVPRNRADVQSWWDSKLKIDKEAAELEAMIVKNKLFQEDAAMRETMRQEQLMRVVYPTQVNNIMAVIGQDIRNIDTMDGKTRALAGTRVDAEIAKFEIAMLNSVGEDNPLLKARLAALKNFGTTLKKVYSGEYNQKQFEIDLAAFRAVSDYNRESMIINPNAPVEQQRTGRDVDKAIRMASLINDSNEEVAAVIGAGKGVEIFTNMLLPQEKGFLENSLGRTTYSDIQTAYQGMTASIATIAKNSPNSPELVEMVNISANNFLVRDYAYFTKNGEKELSADKLQVMGTAAINMLRNPNVATAMSKNPQVYNSVKNLAQDYVDRVQESALESANRTLGSDGLVYEGVTRIIGIPGAGLIPDPGIENKYLIEDNVSPEGIFSFKPKYESFGAFKKAFGSVFTSDAQLQTAYDRVKTTAAKLNTTHAAQIREFGSIRSKLTGQPLKQSIDEIRQGISVFDDVQTPSETQ
jgi:hypothetical protein